MNVYAPEKKLLSLVIGRNTKRLFHTANGTPHLYRNLEDHWVTPRLVKMGLDEKGMGWHSFKRFRKTWLRGDRCLEDLNNYWMAHTPTTMCEVYSHLHEELQLRLDEAERVGYGFVLPKRSIVPIVPKSQEKKMDGAIIALNWTEVGRKLEVSRFLRDEIHCLLNALSETWFQSVGRRS